MFEDFKSMFEDFKVVIKLEGIRDKFLDTSKNLPDPETFVSEWAEEKKVDELPFWESIKLKIIETLSGVIEVSKDEN